MRTSRLVIALAAIVPCAVAAGCSSFSPSLGDTPFYCGSDKPQCPDGYTCTAQGSASICLAPSATLPDAPGSGACTPDPAPVEPNDMISDALDTTVEANKPNIDFAGLSICPAGDVDYYSVEMNGADHLEVTVTDDAAGSPLQLHIETATATLAEGSPVGANELHAFIADPLPAGTYYVVVQAASANPMGTNTYGLDIATCMTPATSNTCPAPMMGSGSGT